MDVNRYLKCFVWIVFLTISLAATSSFSQTKAEMERLSLASVQDMMKENEKKGETVLGMWEEKPAYLEPRAQTADLNMLSQIFGDVVLAAAGQISFSDLVIDINVENIDPNTFTENQASERDANYQTDSVIASMMYVFLLFIATIGFIGVALIAVLMALEAGATGKVLSERYNGFVVGRTLYAFIMLLPLVGGWSLGQYGLFKSVFIVNTVANKLNTVGNRWVYSRNATMGIPVNTYEYRALVEAIYLNEMCKYAVNDHYDDEYGKRQIELAELQNALKNGSFGKRTNAYYKKTVAFFTGKYDNMDEIRMQSKEFGSDGDTDINLLVATYDKDHRYHYKIGNKLTSDSSCGEVKWIMQVGSASTPTASSDSYGVPDAAPGAAPGIWEKTKGVLDGAVDEQSLDLGPRNKAFVKQYFDVHRLAIMRTINQAKDDLETVNTLLQPISKIENMRERDEAFKKMAAENSLVRALGYAIDPTFTLERQDWNYLIFKRLKDYGLSVKNDYIKDSRKLARQFNTILREYERRQRLAPPPDYKNKAEGLIEAAVERSKNYEGNSSNPTPSKSLNNLNAENPAFHSLVINSQKGWMWAGFKWWDLSRAMDFQRQLALQRPVGVPFGFRLDQHDGAPHRRLYNMANTHYYAEANFKFADSIGTMDTVNLQESIEIPPWDTKYMETFSDIHSNDLVGGYNQYKSKLAHALGTKLLDAQFNFDERNLLSGVQNAGHTYMIVGESILLAAAAAKIASKSAKVVGNASESLTKSPKGALISVISKSAEEFIGQAASILFWVGLTFFVIGIVFAVYLPMVPAMMWTISLIGYVEKITGAVLSIPVHMLGHLVPDGAQMINNTSRTGYLTLLYLLISPIIMVLSIHIAMAAQGAFGFFLQDFYRIFMPSMHEEYTVGIPIMLASLVIFCAFIVVVLHMILAWIWKINDELPQYFGASGSNFGEQEVKNNLQGVVANVTGRGEQGITQGMKGAEDNPNHAKDKSAGAKKQGQSPSQGADISNKDFM